MPDLLLALLAFAFVAAITPGPNNLMLLASGANFGFRRTIPHMLGIGVGHSALILTLGLGLAGLFHAWPQAHSVLKAVAVVYMLWLAWKIANAAPPKGETATGRPLTFLQAAAFQWVNPKAWAMAMTAITVYAPALAGDGPGAWGALLVAAAFATVTLPSVSAWTALGQQMARFLTDRVRLRAFNIAMALLLVASLWPILSA